MSCKNFAQVFRSHHNVFGLESACLFRIVFLYSRGTAQKHRETALRTSIRIHGRRFALKPAVINTAILSVLRQFPGTKKWVGGMYTFDASVQCIEFATKHFKDASWTDDAQRLAQQVLQIKANALPAPAKSRIRDYVYKSKPWEHQDKLFRLQRDKEVFAYFMEQGTGKSKSALDTGAWLYSQGKIQAILVIAFPNGVHRKWVLEDIPLHLPDWCNVTAGFWTAQRGEKQMKMVIDAQRGLRLFSMNVEALSTKRGLEAAKKFLLTFPSLLVIDESTSIKTPKAARTKSILKLRTFAPYRRILTGTPATKGPLDLYSQFEFLDEEILGYSSYYAFRSRYAVMKPLPGITDRRGRPIEVVVGYQNLEELQEKIAPYSFRVLKKDCLDLPPKVYQRLYYELTDEQMRHYNNFKEECVTEFRGKLITATLAMTKMLRAHQIACGFLPVDDPEIELGAPIVENNPRLECLMNQLELIEGKVIIVANYRYSLREIYEAVVKKYGRESVVAFKGGMKPAEQDAAKAAFQDPNSKVRHMICQIRATAYGHNLTAADYVIFYCNNFSLELRQQMEDRVHRGGLQHSVTYIDIEAQGTIDSNIIKTLRDNKVIACRITGDPLEEWL